MGGNASFRSSNHENELRVAGLWDYQLNFYLKDCAELWMLSVLVYDTRPQNYRSERVEICIPTCFRYFDRGGAPPLEDTRPDIQNITTHYPPFRCSQNIITHCPPFWRSQNITTHYPPFWRSPNITTHYPPFWRSQNIDTR